MLIRLMRLCPPICSSVSPHLQEGELRLRDPSRPASKGQSSPISLLVLVAAGAGGGGILLNGLFDAGEGVVKSEIVSVSGPRDAAEEDDGCCAHAQLI